MLQTPLDEEVIEQPKFNLNSLALGALLFVVLNSLNYLIQRVVQTSGYYLGLNSYILFGLIHLLPIAIIVLIAYTYVKRIDGNDGQAKRRFIILGIAYVIIHMLQYFYGKYAFELMPEYVYDNLSNYWDHTSSFTFEVIGLVLNVLKPMAIIYVLYRASDVSK